MAASNDKIFNMKVSINADTSTYDGKFKFALSSHHRNHRSMYLNTAKKLTCHHARQFQYYEGALYVYLLLATLIDKVNSDRSLIGAIVI